jgi:hypothetical protein
MFRYPFQGTYTSGQFHAVDRGFVISLRELFLVWTVEDLRVSSYARKTTSPTRILVGAAVHIKFQRVGIFLDDCLPQRQFNALFIPVFKRNYG